MEERMNMLLKNCQRKKCSMRRGLANWADLENNVVVISQQRKWGCSWGVICLRGWMWGIC